MSKHTDGIEEEDPPFFGVQLFGWDIFRIFRDESKEMIKIVLHKDNEFKEFTNINYKVKK